MVQFSITVSITSSALIWSTSLMINKGEKRGKLAMYESMKKSVIRVFDDGLKCDEHTIIQI